MKSNYFFSSFVLFVCASCTVVPVDGFDNKEASELHEVNAPLTGSTIATLAVPWQYRFSDPSVTPAQAAKCRDALFSSAERDDDGRVRMSQCDPIEVDETLFAVAVSGGGVRAAVLGNAVFYHLDQIGLLNHIDMVSGISGGAFGIGLFGVSCGLTGSTAVTTDQSETIQCAEVDRGSVKSPNLNWTSSHSSSDPFYQRFTYNVFQDWVFDLLFVPWHGWRTLVTEYNRTRVIADSFADGPYQLPHDDLPFGLGSDGFEFRDFNPKRPNIIIQATDMTMPEDENEVPGRCFRFTRETFAKINSDLSQFPVADAVAASNAFSVLFPPYTLKDFSEDKKERYVHLQDGGIRDHISLSPVLEVIFHTVDGIAPYWSDEIPSDFCDISRYPQLKQNEKTFDVGFIEEKPGSKHWLERNPKNIVVLVIDASKPPEGIISESATAKYKNASLFASILDSLIPFQKGLQAVDTMLDDQRVLRARETLDAIKLINSLNETKFSKSKKEINVASIVLSNHDYFSKHRLKVEKGEGGACDLNDGILVHGLEDGQVSVHSLQKVYERDSEKCKDDEVRNRLYRDLNNMSLGLSLDRKISSEAEAEKQKWVTLQPEDWIKSGVLGGELKENNERRGEIDQIQTIIQASGVLVARMAETWCKMEKGQMLFAKVESIECKNLKHLCQYVPAGRRQEDPWGKVCREQGIAETGGTALLN